MYKNIFSKIFSKVFFFVFLFNLCFSTFVPTVNAQGTTLAQNNTNTSVLQGGARGSPIAQPQANNANSQETRGDCSFGWDGFSLTDCLVSIIDYIFGLILQGINWFLEQLVLLSSFALDFAVYSTIVEFKSNFAELGLNPNITEDSAQYTQAGSLLFGAQREGLIYYIWGMIRDFINIVIFITIIYHAVQSMFVGFVETKKKFISLLVFSVIINFSLLFVQIAIDVSNILSLQAYTLAVKPKNTDSFYAFRTSAGEGVPNSFGEYIMKSVNMGELFRSSTGQRIAEEEVQSLERTFFFQLGKFAVLIGMIYIFLYMAGLLFYRAVSFMLAMIMAPLITLDVFFSYFGKTSAQMQEFSKEIRGKIGSIRADFYESLVKGPLLIFFIYLVGVFAEAIFTQGAMARLSDSLNRMEDVQSSTGPFISSIGVFFKFTIFLLLANEVLKRINAIKFDGSSGRLSGWGTKFANYTLGRGLGGAARLTGIGLQNTLGRVASNSKVLTSLSNRSLNWKNADPKTVGGSIKRAIGGSAYKGVGLLRNGTYDAGNLVSGLNKLTGGSLAKSIKSATGSDIDFGKRVTESISDRDKAALKARQDARDKNIEEAKKGDQVTKDDIDHVNHTEKSIKFGNEKFTVDDFKDLMSKAGEFTRASDGSYERGTLKISEKDYKSLSTPGDADILLKIKEAEEKNLKTAEHHAAERGEKRAEEIANEYKKGDRSGVGAIAKAQDVVAFRDRPFSKVLGEGATTRELRVDTARVAQKQGKEKVKEDKKIVDFITGTFSTSVSSLDKDLNDIIKRQIEAITRDPSLSDVEKRLKSDSLKEEQRKLSRDLKEFMGSIPKYYTSNKDELKENLEKFDSEDAPTGYKKIMDAKKKAHEYIIKAAAELGNAGGVDEKLGRIYKSIGRRSTSLNDMDELYKKAKPAEHGHDDHSKDKSKDGGKKDGKKEEKPGGH